VETGRTGRVHTARLYVDGERAAEAAGFPKLTLPYGGEEVLVAFDAAGLVDGQAARCELRPPEPGEEGRGKDEPVKDGPAAGDAAGKAVAFAPPEGTRAARREAFARAHPVLYASRHVAVAAARVLLP